LFIITELIKQVSGYEHTTGEAYSQPENVDE